MSFIAAAIIGGAAIGAVGSAVAANQSAGAIKDASKRSTNTELAMFEQNRADLAPYRFGGYQAYNTMLNELGLTPYANPTYGPEGGAAGGASAPSDFGNSTYGQLLGRVVDRVGDRSGAPAAPGQSGTGTIGGFQASPGYEFVRSEGTRGIERSAAARGGLSSGNTLRALDQFNSGLASQEYGNWWNRLAATSGVGQTATQQGAALGANAANNIAGNQMAAGDARASGYLTGYAGIANSVNSGLNNWMLYRGGYFNPPAGGVVPASSGGGGGTWGGGR